jgi:molybdate transport system permease protein
VRASSAAGLPRRRPPLFAFPAILALFVLVVPLIALIVQAPWSAIGTELAAPEVRQALWLSITTSLWATALAILFGVPLAWVLARFDFRGRATIRALIILPMVLPPVVGGVALLLAFGRRGLLGQWLDQAFGITIPFTTTAVVIAELFVAMPFLILAVEAALRSAERGYEEAAATLGASRWLVCRRITLPLVAPSLGAGAALCWARALGEFGATITFAGNLPGTTQTMPLAVYLALQSRPEGAIVLSLILLAVSLGVLVLLRDRWFAAA